MKENCRPVLRAKVRPLPVHLRRVVHLPEHFQQLFVAHLGRIKGYLHNFGVPRLIRTNILVRGIQRLAAAVTHSRLDYPRHLLKCSFNSPEATRPKRCNLCHWLLLTESISAPNPRGADSLSLKSKP